MAYSGMLRPEALVKIHVSEELSASFIRVTRISELGTRAVTSNDALGISSQLCTVCYKVQNLFFDPHCVQITKYLPTFADSEVSHWERDVSRQLLISVS
jgi:hypothetical protein